MFAAFALAAERMNEWVKEKRYFKSGALSQNVPSQPHTLHSYQSLESLYFPAFFFAILFFILALHLPRRGRVTLTLFCSEGLA